jgi:hypothetical protein
LIANELRLKVVKNKELAALAVLAKLEVLATFGPAGVFELCSLLQGTLHLIFLFLSFIPPRAAMRMGLGSGRGGDGMRSAWNHCAPDGVNFLQSGGMGLGSVFSGLGGNGVWWGCGAAIWRVSKLASQQVSVAVRRQGAVFSGADERGLALGGAIRIINPALQFDAPGNLLGALIGCLTMAFIAGCSDVTR